MSACLKAVLFDLDGTLVDSAPDIAECLNGVLESRGVAPFAEAAVRLMVGGGVRKLIERAYASSGFSDAPDIDADAAAFIELYAARPLRLSRAYPHADDTLRALHRNGIAIGLCTNKPEAISRDMMAGLGWTGLFGAIVGGDTTPARKPDPAPVLKCLELLGMYAETAMLVGDSAHDLHAARAAGVRCVLAAHGYSAIPARDLHPGGVIDRLDEVLHLLD